MFLLDWFLSAGRYVCRSRARSAYSFAFIRLFSIYVFRCPFKFIKCLVPSWSERQKNQSALESLTLFSLSHIQDRSFFRLEVSLSKGSFACFLLSSVYRVHLASILLQRDSSLHSLVVSSSRTFWRLCNILFCFSWCLYLWSRSAENSWVCLRMDWILFILPSLDWATSRSTCSSAESLKFPNAIRPS